MRSYGKNLRAAVMAAVLFAPCAANADNFRTLYQFQGGADGANPVGSILNFNGSFYGASIGGGSQNAGTVFQLLPPAVSGNSWSDKVLHSFAADGTEPFGSLIPFKSSLLGTTFSSTLSGNGGRVFQLKPMVTPAGAWKEVPLHAFGNAGDGWGPEAGLTKLGTAYYGTTLAGGVAGCKGYSDGADGCGTVFSLVPPAVVGGPWTEKVVYGFAGGSDGAVASSSLLKFNGALYGVTTLGGSGPCNLPATGGGCGTVFSISPQGVKTILYSFKGGVDGAYPTGKLIHVQGAFWGTTSSGGGTGCGGAGCGTIFRLLPPSVAGGPWREKVFHAFQGGSDGAGPVAGVLNIPYVGVNVTAGTLYGTTVYGGGTGCGGNGCGTVYKIPIAGINVGVETIVHAFQGGSDGAFPVGDLINYGGAAMGTTEAGGNPSCSASKTGAPGCGVVFSAN